MLVEPMRRFAFLLRFAGIALIANAVASCMALSVAFTPAPITLASGVPGGIYHPVGNALCRIYNLADAEPARLCAAINSDGSVANVRRLGSGETDFALSQTDVAYAAVHGIGPFAAFGADRKLRLVIVLYQEAFTVLARADSGVIDVKDLRGKRVGIGKKGAGSTFTQDVVLGAYGWSLSDHNGLVELGPAEQNQALCDNRVDAIIFDAGHPNGLIQEATTGCQAKLAQVTGPPTDRLSADHPYYITTVIPGGMYAGNPDDVTTIGTRAVLLTSIDQPDAVVYAMVKAVFDNLADFRRLHPALTSLEVKDMVPGAAVIPIHPGALGYYREAGLLP